jgi:hypothetical protein
MGKGEREAEEKAWEERNKRREMAYKAQMREIVPGLFLGNVEASHNPAMLRENQRYSLAY